MKLSIVIPVVDEAPLLAAFLRHLRERAPDAELIVVDGGSRDGSAQIAKPLADRTLHSRRGRAVQMNAGAQAATGDTLLFLHADSQLSNAMCTLIDEALRDLRNAGGAPACAFRSASGFIASAIRWGISASIFSASRSAITASSAGARGLRRRRLSATCRSWKTRNFTAPPPRRTDAAAPRGHRHQSAPLRATRSVAHDGLLPAILALYVSGVRVETLHAIYR